MFRHEQEKFLEMFAAEATDKSGQEDTTKKSGQEGTTDRPTQEGTTMQQESGTSAPFNITPGTPGEWLSDTMVVRLHKLSRYYNIDKLYYSDNNSLHTMVLFLTLQFDMMAI